MHGRGSYIWADGRKYEGEYVNDKKDGYGVYTWADGRKYQGFWANGKQDGIGKYISNDGSVKWGVWEDGKRQKWIDPQNDEEVFRYRDGSKVPNPLGELNMRESQGRSSASQFN